jgi:hypothetical protein
MAKKDEQVVEEVQPTEEVKTEPTNIEEDVLKEGGDMKMKSKPKMKKYNQPKDNTIKVDLSKKETEGETKEEETPKVNLTKEEPKEEVVEEIKEEQPKEEVKEETPVLEEIQEEEEKIVEEKAEELQEEVEESSSSKL